jgi:hypothetical protein
LKSAKDFDFKDNWAWNILGQEEYVKILRIAQQQAPIKGEQLQYEALLNKNQEPS